METPQTVHEWVDKTFPDYATKGRRALAMIEETVELGLAAGLTSEDIMKAVLVPILKQKERNEAGDDAEELGDVLLSVYAYGGVAKIDAHAELDKKMAINRKRPDEYYRMKNKQKKELGMPV